MNTDKPSSATVQTVTTVKRRGRKTNKIQQAFANISTTPVPVVEYAHKYAVSVAVMRQGRRFNQGEGVIRVRKDKITKELMIWRDLSAVK